ncbi:MAG: YeeE/YedE thiosulfate transporter family protein [Bacteroidota bacterium]
MIEIIKQPWPWYVAGPAISLVMFLLIYFGKNFGVSSTLRTMCSIGGAGKIIDFFKFDWKDQLWNLVFVGGALLGGWITSAFLMDNEMVAISNSTVESLTEYNIIPHGYVPQSIFSWASVFSLQGFIMIIIGGFLVGFGTRWAGGCTSGHAITGLSNLQLPSLVSVIGFFIGGLITTHFLLPLIFNL